MDSFFFHPKLVHLPIALAVLMPIVASAFLLAWWRAWLPARSWLFAIGLQAILFGSGFMALRSGEAEQERVERVVPERFIEAHEEAAEAFLGASGVVLGLMALAGALGSRRGALPTATAATLGTLVVFALGYRAGHAGGDLVYEHGAAQAYVHRSAGAEAPAAPSADDD